MVTEPDIQIKKIDESWIYIDAEKSIIYELSDSFTFKAKNYRFHPLYKNKIWDGNIRLVNRQKQQILKGLTKHVCEWAKDREYNVVVDNATDYGYSFSDLEAREFINSLNLPDTISDRDYQFKSFVNAMRDMRSVVISPTASGKSLIIYFLIRKYLMDNMTGKGLLIVPRTSLVEQMYSDFEEYGWNANQYCHKVYSGYDKNTTKQVVISTWQSIYKMPKDYFHQFDWVIGDEAHLFEAKSLSHIMENCINAAFRVGTTGSLDDGVVHELTLQGHFGPIRKVISTKELMDQGYVSELSIKALMLKHPESVCKLRKDEKWNYQKEIDYLISCEERNKFIVNLALSLKENTLILYNHVDKHGNELKAKLDSMVKDKSLNKKVFYIHGGIKTTEREDIRKFVNSHDNCIVLASYGTYSTGINIPNLQNVIFALGFRSKIRNIQSIGRSLRLDNKDNKATLFDISDDLISGKSVNYSLKHFKERLETYFKESFHVKTYKVNLPASSNGS